VRALSEFGEMYIEILGLDEPHLVNYRRRVLTSLREFERVVAELGDIDLVEELEDTFGYPKDIPDLRLLKPKQNSRSGSERECYYAWLMNGKIARIY
jgi:hypothetical protein